jgi:SSS family solute:Na+ symporter
MFLAAYMGVRLLPEGIGFTDALAVSGKLGKLNVITTGFEKTGHFDWSDKYNIFSGIIGGFFLALSYFGADQSQVGRYLTAKSIKESRMGLLMNGFIKVPMQFLILLIGTLVFTFYQFTKAPVFFNEALVTKAHSTAYKPELEKIEFAYGDYESAIPGWQLNYNKFKKEGNTVEAGNVEQKIILANQIRDSLRKEYKKLLSKAVPNSDTSDTNYIFLRFVVDNLPAGLVGLLIAIIFLASWGSIAAAINSLASCTMVDFHRQFAKNKESGEDEYRLSKRYTLMWGVFCIVVAMYTYNLGNSLIETVNELGSLFYGSILGVFLVAFFFKKINNGNTVFYSALLTEVAVLIIYILSKMKLIGLGFLWLNPIGALGVILFSLLLNGLLKQKENPAI